MPCLLSRCSLLLISDIEFGVLCDVVHYVVFPAEAPTDEALYDAAG